MRQKYGGITADLKEFCETAFRDMKRNFASEI